jgi:hypothetical protein
MTALSCGAVAGLLGHEPGALVEAVKETGDAGMLLGVGEQVDEQVKERDEAGGARGAERARGRAGGREQRRPRLGGDDADAVERGVARLRLGTLMIRANASSSLGLASRRRYATASLTAARS